MTRDDGLGLVYRQATGAHITLCCWCGASVGMLCAAPHDAAGLVFCSASCAVQHETAARARSMRQQAEANAAARAKAQTNARSMDAGLDGWP